MKQITIYALLPLLRKGWVAYDGNGWAWFTNKPKYILDKFISDYRWMIRIGDGYNLSGKGCAFNIAPYDGDWKNSLIKVKDKEV